MKISLIIFFLIHFLSIKAQDYAGIKFEKNTSWSQIKERAKKENKYIFLDTYTTWCAPCIQMEQNIFPQKKVGDFFNKNFLNVKIQMDKTKKDSEEVKKWYADAKIILNTYKINLFPTYLFFNPNGNLVHEIKGGSQNVDEFIVKANAALNPATQYVNLKNEYANGNRDTTFLKLIIATATSTYDLVNARTYIKSYLETQKNLITDQNIKFIAASLNSSKDIGYEIILNKPSVVIPIIGEQYRNYILNTIAFDENILPMLKNNGEKEISAGGMINYNGELNKNVDWEAMQLMLNSNYMDKSDRLMVNAKTTYYKWSGDWLNLNKTLLEYTNSNNTIEEDLICNWLQYFVSFGKEEYYNDALKWASALLTINKNSSCVKNYGILLYKAGQTEDAIKVLLVYKESFKAEEESVRALVAKIKNGQKID